MYLKMKLLFTILVIFTIFTAANCFPSSHDTDCSDVLLRSGHYAICATCIHVAMDDVPVAARKRLAPMIKKDSKKSKHFATLVRNEIIPEKCLLQSFYCRLKNGAVYLHFAIL